MKNQFCTGCGAPAATDQNHCDNCGLRLHDAPVASPGSGAYGLAAHRKPSTLITWLDVGGKSLAFGTPLVAVFDFLSPRIALLPTAAVVAVVGLVVAVALRKFVAPALPAASWLRRVLAPEATLHKSPMLIATGVLSALMVTGAAWSSVNATEGGVIASKFDAAKNAQMQLGVLQGLQKEQRQQTAVLEDIREGRSNNPRKELVNLGVLWSNENFRSALVNSDLRVAQLFMDGGMGTDTTTLITAMFSAPPATQALFAKGAGAARPDACEQALTASSQQLLQNLGELAWSVWRRACPDAESQRRAHAALSGMRLAATTSYNTALAAFKQAEKAHADLQRKPFASVAACTAHELRDDAKSLVAEFSRSGASTGFRNSTTITARQMFLAELWSELTAVQVIRDQTGREPPAGFIAEQLRPKVERFCSDVQSDPPAFTDKPPARDAIEGYSRAMTRLGVD